jgi:hypothetical protein
MPGIVIARQPVPPPQLLGRGVLSVGPNPPIASEVGDLWWRTSSDAALYLWYDNGASQQWVAATPGIPSQPPSNNPPTYIAFPAQPWTPGQQFTATNGVTYQWDGQVWTALSSLEVPPNSIGPDQIFVTGTLFNGNEFGLSSTERTLTMLNGQQTLLTNDMIETRYGPIQISGNIPIQIQNATGSAVQVQLDLHALVFGVFVPIISPSLFITANPNTTATLFVPLDSFLNCGGNTNGLFTGTIISLFASKLSGTDTGITITCRSGPVSLIEWC